MIFKNQNGQTIIEAVVALAAVFVIVAAIAVVILNAVNNSQFVKNQNLANKYAQQGMEYVRGIQAGNLDEFNTLSGSYGMGDSGSELTEESLTVNVGSSHIRNLYIVENEEPCINTGSVVPEEQNIGLKKVTVEVRWSSGKCGSSETEDRFCHDTTLVSCIPYEKSPNVEP